MEPSWGLPHRPFTGLAGAHDVHRVGGGRRNCDQQLRQGLAPWTLATFAFSFERSHFEERSASTRICHLPGRDQRRTAMAPSA